jgi:hypothetical protein
VESSGGATHFAKALPGELTGYDPDESPFNPPNFVAKPDETVAHRLRGPEYTEHLYGTERPVRYGSRRGRPRQGCEGFALNERTPCHPPPMTSLVWLLVFHRRFWESPSYLLCMSPCWLRGHWDPRHWDRHSLSAGRMAPWHGRRGRAAALVAPPRLAPVREQPLVKEPFPYVLLVSRRDLYHVERPAGE